MIIIVQETLFFTAVMVLTSLYVTNARIFASILSILIYTKTSVSIEHHFINNYYSVVSVITFSPLYLLCNPSSVNELLRTHYRMAVSKPTF
jgi:hypothetical protein